MGQKQKIMHASSCMVMLFVLFTFYILGGGTQEDCEVDDSFALAGINTTLPEADAQELSASRLDALKKDMERQQQARQTEQRQNASSFRWYHSPTENTDSVSPKASPKTAATKVEVVEEPIQSAPSVLPKRAPATLNETQRKQVISQKKRQLEQLLGVSSDQDASSKIQDQQTYPSVEVAQEQCTGFYGLESEQNPARAIRAVVHGEHAHLGRGGIVKLRLLDDIQIQTTRIPAGTFLYGRLSFASCRALIHIENVQYQNAIYPFRGTIYDKDGFEGLYVPDNRVDEATRKAGSQALSNMNVRIPSASLVASAANAALGAVQSVAQSSVSEQKISISSNYLVTIKPANP